MKRCKARYSWLAAAISRFNQNHLRPCPLLDNPEELPKMAEASGAHSTDLQRLEDPRDLSAKCAKTAAKWAPAAERLWEERRKERREKLASEEDEQAMG